MLIFHAISMQHDIPFLTVVSSLKRLMRYSLGSVALGSLVVSVVEWVRFILECLRRKLKLVDSARESCFGKAMASSSECCLGCIDWTLKSINRNAYIMVSMKICYTPVLPILIVLNAFTNNYIQEQMVKPIWLDILLIWCCLQILISRLAVAVVLSCSPFQSDSWDFPPRTRENTCHPCYMTLLLNTKFL